MTDWDELLRWKSDLKVLLGEEVRPADPPNVGVPWPAEDELTLAERCGDLRPSLCSIGLDCWLNDGIKPAALAPVPARLRLDCCCCSSAEMPRPRLAATFLRLRLVALSFIVDSSTTSMPISHSTLLTSFINRGGSLPDSAFWSIAP